MLTNVIVKKKNLYNTITISLTLKYQEPIALVSVSIYAKEETYWELTKPENKLSTLI